MKKIISCILVICMLASVCALAACSGKDSGANATNANGEPVSDPTGQVITVGYTLFEPMNYEDENGNLIGFDTDLAKAVFEGLGYQVEFKEITWANKYTDLQSGNIDCIWNGFTANSSDDGVARSELVDFSKYYMENYQIVVVKKDSAIASTADLKGKIGEAEEGSAGEEYIQAIDGVNYKGVDKQMTALMEVNSGAADFAVVDALLAKSKCGVGDYADLKIVDSISGDVEYYAVGFVKGSDLTAKVNEQFAKLAADGTIMRLAEQYGVEKTVITDFSK